MRKPLNYNDLYPWNGQTAVNRNYTPDGLNQYSAVGGTSFSYDANGNLTSDGTNTFTYDVENRLVARSSGGTTAALRYDPLGRLYEVLGSATGTTRFLHDGSDLVAEYNGSGTLLTNPAQKNHFPTCSFSVPTWRMSDSSFPLYPFASDPLRILAPRNSRPALRQAQDERSAPECFLPPGHTAGGSRPDDPPKRRQGLTSPCWV